MGGVGVCSGDRERKAVDVVEVKNQQNHLAYEDRDGEGVTSEELGDDGEKRTRQKLV